MHVGFFSEQIKCVTTIPPFLWIHNNSTLLVINSFCLSLCLFVKACVLLAQTDLWHIAPDNGSLLFCFCEQHSIRLLFFLKLCIYLTRTNPYMCLWSWVNTRVNVGVPATLRAKDKCTGMILYKPWFWKISKTQLGIAAQLSELCKVVKDLR